MFNLGFTEMLMICALALIFIGPRQLPEVARTIGKFLNELRRASDEAMSVFRETHTKSQDFLRKTEEDIKNQIEGEKKPEEAHDKSQSSQGKLES